MNCVSEYLFRRYEVQESKDSGVDNAGQNLGDEMGMLNHNDR